MTVCYSYGFTIISPEVVTLTSSLLSTSNQREMPGRLCTRVRVVLSTQRLCIDRWYVHMSICWLINTLRTYSHPLLWQVTHNVRKTYWETPNCRCRSHLISHFIIHAPPPTLSASILVNMPTSHKVILTACKTLNYNHTFMFWIFWTFWAGFTPQLSL